MVLHRVLNKINLSVARASARISLIVVAVVSLIISASAQAEYRLNFPDPVTQTARDIFDLHMLIFWICVAIFVLVFGVMFYSIFAHRKSKNYEASQFSHSTKVEIVWTIIPFLILVAMAIPATQVLIKMEDTTKSDLTIKITGYQWKWGYEYLDSGINFYSTLATPRAEIDQFDKENAVPQNENYLLQVDNHLVVPSGRKVRALITANDVIHAWWIPAFGTKKDAIPGYINELWFNVDEGKEGIYRGQCAELCGKDHAFMPIVVEVVTSEQFEQWVAAGGAFSESSVESIASTAEAAPSPATLRSAADADASSAVEAAKGPALLEKLVPASNAAEPNTGEPASATSTATYTLDELMASGEKASAVCTACHGADGKGIPGVFPAIAGSAIATGPIDEHIRIVMFGKSGTAMQAFAAQLSDEEIAAVVTYQRNAFGNDTGDLVLPSDIQALRK